MAGAATDAAANGAPPAGARGFARLPARGARRMAARPRRVAGSAGSGGPPAATADQRGAIAAVAEASPAVGGASGSAHGMAVRSVRRRRAGSLPASAAEMREAAARWSVRLDDGALRDATGGDTECIICLSDMEAHEHLVQLPCSEGASAEAAPRGHLFHAECISRWLLTSAACPTCRRGVRPMLRTSA